MTPSAASARGQPALDVREEILRSVAGRRVIAAIATDQAGVVSGVSLAKTEAAKLGVFLREIVGEGASVQAGDEIARFEGTPRQVVMTEDILIGLLAKPSGIATRTREFVTRTGGRPRVVSGGWKKMPSALKEMIRSAVSAGGAHSRILPGPFAYLDKNYVEMLGGIRESLAAVAHLHDVAKVIQVKGRYADVATEALQAVEHGADVVFIDTGRAEDVEAVARSLDRHGLRKQVQLAFGGGVTLENVDALKVLDLDILDIGRQIVDAPLLDMRLEIIDVPRVA
jgi:nicotinate-nucleotide pyrophosphorylase (carboxylating)